MTCHTEITLQAVAVAIEDDPPYTVVGQNSADPAEFFSSLASSTDYQSAEIRDTVQQLNVSGADAVVDCQSWWRRPGKLG